MLISYRRNLGLQDDIVLCSPVDTYKYGIRDIYMIKAYSPLHLLVQTTSLNGSYQQGSLLEMV